MWNMDQRAARADLGCKSSRLLRMRRVGHRPQNATAFGTPCVTGAWPVRCTYRRAGTHPCIGAGRRALEACWCMANLLTEEPGSRNVRTTSCRVDRREVQRRKRERLEALAAKANAGLRHIGLQRPKRVSLPSVPYPPGLASHHWYNWHCPRTGLQNENARLLHCAMTSVNPASSPAHSTRLPPAPGAVRCLAPARAGAPAHCD